MKLQGVWNIMTDEKKQMNNEQKQAKAEQKQTDCATFRSCPRSRDGRHYWTEDAANVKRCFYCGLIVLPE